MISDLRTGSGLDFHRLIEDADRPLLLGAVEIPGELALEGHSDADLVLHALADAVLGALGLGDIGEFFPDTDPANKNLDSVRIITLALEKMRAAGYRLANLDVTVIGQKPRLSPYKPAIRESLARICGVDLDRVGLKATTTEKMGALGRAEGLGCLATVLLTATN